MNKLYLSLLAFLGLLLALPAVAQNNVPPAPRSASDTNNADNTPIYKYVQQSPVFPGVLNSWLAGHLEYPEFAKINGIEGKTYIQFVVAEDGRVSDVTVLRSSHSVLDREAMRVVRMMPAWTPGKNNGAPVKSYFSLPFNFELGTYGNNEKPDVIDSCDHAFVNTRSGKYSKFPDFTGVPGELVKVPMKVEAGEVTVTVNLLVTISKTGQIKNPHVLCSTEPVFAQKVLKAYEKEIAKQNTLKQWKPAMDTHSNPVDCMLILPIEVEAL